ncbi:MAG: acyl-CoA thioesterase [Spirochaetaceae bacterium]|jgi:acyl-CoA thioester hydrolase|nr:acyl-CoA thioesterase [Spirochaetaceae bacterium]
MWTTTIRPRIGDTDALGHIHNNTFGAWFEQGRYGLFKIFGHDDGKLNPADWPLIMAHTDYDFIAQAYLQPDVEIRTSISRIGTKSFTVYHEAWQEGRLCAKGNAVICYYNHKEQKSAPLPEDKKALLQEHMTD